VPGVADGYLTGQAAGVTVPPLIALLSIHGTAQATGPAAGTTGPEGLTRLLSVVEGRLREEVARVSRPPG
jgi:hypothetical protein